MSFRTKASARVLDTVQERAGVNTRVPCDADLGPRHRRPGGAWLAVSRSWRTETLNPTGAAATTPRSIPNIYGNTILGRAGRAPEYPDWDMLADVIPEARRRGMRSFAISTKAATRGICAAIRIS